MGRPRTAKVLEKCQGGYVFRFRMSTKGSVFHEVPNMAYLWKYQKR